MRNALGSSRNPAIWTARTLTAFVLLGLLALPVRASQVRPLTLEEMTQRAATIFSGRCVGRSVEVHGRLGREVTVFTFQVDRALKGEPRRTFTFRQIGPGPGPDGRRRAVAGLPDFQAGEEVILFLYGESSLGLRSPVGFAQGKFTVVTDKHGRRYAINGFGNAGLLEGPGARGRASSLDPEQLLERVRSLVSAGRGRGAGRPAP